MKINGIFFTDFDGTLYDHAFGFDEKGLKGMQLLKDNGCLRVVATGRANFERHPEIDVKAFCDYVIFSSGSVIYDCAQGNVLYLDFLPKDQVYEICRILRDELKLNFMAQNVWPQNHTFAYWPQNSQISDFKRRVDLFSQWATYAPAPPAIDATEIITIIPPQRRLEVVQTLTGRFPGLSIITATSPLDKSSIWLEIFPPGVSKSKTCARLLSLLGLTGLPAAAIGNDYNDLDMLQWADYGYVVANTPQDLWGAFEVVASCGAGGVYEAAVSFLQKNSLI